MDYLSKQGFRSTDKVAGLVLWTWRDEGSSTLGKESKHRDQTSWPMVVDTNLKHTSTDRADLLIIPPILKLTSKCSFCLPASAVATDPFRMSIWRHHVQTLGSQSCILSTSTSLFLFSRYLRMIKGEREAKEAHLYF